MRKIIAAILALTLALGACFMLSSCGGNRRPHHHGGCRQFRTR